MNPNALADKEAALLDYFRSAGSAAVAFSGGTDSTLLAAAAHEVLGDKAAAITVRSAFTPAREAKEAEAFCRDIGLTLITLTVPVLENETIRSNPADRCYHCKKLLFTKILAEAERRGLAVVCEGSNTDDLADYRPGRKAIEELGVASPLLLAGISKAEVRALLKARDLPAWKKPSAACLASRIPYGTPLAEEDLIMVDRAEMCLADLGFSGVRVRKHGKLARIETQEADIARLADPAVRSLVTERLAELGFSFVTLDLAGYRMGSLNPDEVRSRL